MPSAPPAVEAVLSLAEGAESGLLGEQQTDWVARLAALGAGLGEALDWCAEHDPERGLLLAAALWRYWVVAGELRLGRQQLAWLLALVPSPSPVRLSGLTASALLAAFAGEHAEAAAAAQEAMPLARALDDELRLATLDLIDGWCRQASGDVAGAGTRFDEALERFRDAGHTWGTATALLGLGELARSEGQFPQARDLYREALTLFARLGDGAAIAASQVNLGFVALALHTFEEARAHLTEAVRTCESLANRSFLAGALLGVAALQRAEGRPESAARLLGESRALLEATGSAFELADRLVADREESELRRLLGAGYFAEWRRGHDAPDPRDRALLAR
jgi:tetratricopeptide (TPR) repeat protein